MKICARTTRLLLAAAAFTLCPVAVGDAPWLYEAAEKGLLDPETTRDETIRRSRVVGVDAALLPRAGAALGARIRFPLFGDAGLAGVVTNVERTIDHAEVYTGVLEGPREGWFAMVLRDGMVTADIREGTWGLYQVRPFPDAAGQDLGLHVVRQVDESKYLPCATGPEHVVSVLPDLGVDGEVVIQDDGSVIDVLVMYTAQAREGQGGRSAMNSLVDLAITLTNNAYVNSDVSPRVRLVYRGVIDYTESGTAGTDLSRWRSTSDGFMDEVHCIRNAVGADMCALLVNSFNACGIAYLMGNPSSGFATSAFSVTARGCVSGYTFAHELGHNQGSHHDRDNAGSSPAYPYSYGYRTPNNAWRTVMAYTPGTRVPYFSNPNKFYQGLALGLPVGDPAAAYNALSISNTANIVSNFRQSLGDFKAVERVSISSAGVQGNNPSGDQGVHISPSGRYVAFASRATTLVAGAGGTLYGIFVHDLQTGLTTHTSVGMGGAAPTGGHSTNPTVSDNGRVVFTSAASNLAPNDTNGFEDIFYREGSTTTLISLATSGSSGNGASTNGRISRDGSAIVYQTEATDIVPGDVNGPAPDVLLRRGGITQRASISSSGAPANARAGNPDLSSNGLVIAFDSDADNLVADDANNVSDVFVRDLATGVTSRVSVPNFGGEANGPSSRPYISGDGRYVAFNSAADNLVQNDTNGAQDVFVHDRQTGRTQRVSLGTAGAQINGPSIVRGISSDGRMVLFSTAVNMPGDSNNLSDLYVHDRAWRKTTRVSYSFRNLELNAATMLGAISTNGRYAAFATTSNIVTPCDTNLVSDAFFSDMGDPPPPPCAADYNRDGTSDFFDYLDFVADFSNGSENADFNNDGQVDFFDYLDFIIAYDAGC